MAYGAVRSLKKYSKLAHTKAELLQVGIFFLIHLLLNKLEIKETNSP